jgi:hypothetical protein
VGRASGAPARLSQSPSAVQAATTLFQLSSPREAATRVRDSCPPGLARASRMAPNERPTSGFARQAGREGELHYRFVRSRLGPRHGSKDKDWRAAASRHFVRAPRAGGRPCGKARARASGPCARRAAYRRSCVSGCAPVGPNFERRGDRVVPQFRRSSGWKIATPRANEPKGAWWSVFHDPELTSLCGSSWCPTRRSKRTRPIIARAGAHQ